mmetsp:Transcript_1909/g.3351  ORF Transcript_1909/g.3351 Transcript_1909/m.3351 type:complete len:672 (-) Transcript_1909:66-2081(-)
MLPTEEELRNNNDNSVVTVSGMNDGSGEIHHHDHVDPILSSSLSLDLSPMLSPRTLDQLYPGTGLSDSEDDTDDNRHIISNTKSNSNSNHIRSSPVVAPPAAPHLPPLLSSPPPAVEDLSPPYPTIPLKADPALTRLPSVHDVSRIVPPPVLSDGQPPHDPRSRSLPEISHPSAPTASVVGKVASSTRSSPVMTSALTSSVGSPAVTSSVVATSPLAVTSSVSTKAPARRKSEVTLTPMEPPLRAKSPTPALVPVPMTSHSKLLEPLSTSPSRRLNPESLRLDLPLSSLPAAKDIRRRSSGGADEPLQKTTTSLIASKVPSRRSSETSLAVPPLTSLPATKVPSRRNSDVSLVSVENSSSSRPTSKVASSRLPDLQVPSSSSSRPASKVGSLYRNSAEDLSTIPTSSRPSSKVPSRRNSAASASVQLSPTALTELMPMNPSSDAASFRSSDSSIAPPGLNALSYRSSIDLHLGAPTSEANGSPTSERQPILSAADVMLPEASREKSISPIVDMVPSSQSPLALASLSIDGPVTVGTASTLASPNIDGPITVSATSTLVKQGDSSAKQQSPTKGRSRALAVETPSSGLKPEPRGPTKPLVAKTNANGRSPLQARRTLSTTTTTNRSPTTKPALPRSSSDVAVKPRPPDTKNLKAVSTGLRPRPPLRAVVGKK